VKTQWLPRVCVDVREGLGLADSTSVSDSSAAPPDRQGPSGLEERAG
jgi:hypothetical protein